MSHKNDGKCQQCQVIFNRYPGFHSGLRRWFEDFQADHPEAHISCAGRGKQDQEDCFRKKASRAHFGQSSHNVNAAIDIFSEVPGKDIYDLDWYKKILAPEVPSWLAWYGAPEFKDKFPEFPHVELRAWRNLLAKGQLTLVEMANAA